MVAGEAANGFASSSTLLSTAWSQEQPGSKRAAAGLVKPASSTSERKWDEIAATAAHPSRAHPNLSSHGAVVHQVTQRRDDMRDGIDPRHDLEPSGRLSTGRTRWRGRPEGT